MVSGVARRSVYRIRGQEGERIYHSGGTKNMIRTIDEKPDVSEPDTEHEYDD